MNMQAAQLMLCSVQAGAEPQPTSPPLLKSETASWAADIHPKHEDGTFTQGHDP